MKKQIIYLIFLVVLPFSLFSQAAIDLEMDVEVEELESDNLIVPFALVEQAPKFRKCKKMTGMELKKCFKEKLNQYVAKTVVYPKEYIKEAIETKVFVVFKVDREGKVVDIRTRSSRKDKELFKKEAIRVIESVPKLKPAEHRGEKVAVTYTTIVYFSL